jgi:hypothetical protein
MSIKWRQAGDSHLFDWPAQSVSIRMNWRAGFEKRNQFLIGQKRVANCAVAHSSRLQRYSQYGCQIEQAQKVTTRSVLGSKFSYVPWGRDREAPFESSDFPFCDVANFSHDGMEWWMARRGRVGE